MASREQILVLRQTIAEIEAAGADQFRIIEADLLFHCTILQSSGNRLCGRLFQVIHRSMMNMRGPADCVPTSHHPRPPGVSHLSGIGSLPRFT